jgi:hypothetical protein
MTTETPAAIRMEVELPVKPAIALSTLANLQCRRPAEVAAEILASWLMEHGAAATDEAKQRWRERQRLDAADLNRQLTGRRPGRPRRITSPR